MQVSVATLLSLLQQGSGGNTEAQLTDVLNLKTSSLDWDTAN